MKVCKLDIQINRNEKDKKWRKISRDQRKDSHAIRTRSGLDEENGKAKTRGPIPCYIVSIVRFTFLFCVCFACVCCFFFVLSHSLSFFCRLSFLFFFLFFFFFFFFFDFMIGHTIDDSISKKKKSAISKSHPSYFLVCSVCAGFPNTSWRTLWPRKLAWIFVAALCRSGSVRSIPSSSFMASFAWNNRLQRRRVDLLLQIGASLLRQYFARSMFVNGVKGLLHKRCCCKYLQRWVYVFNNLL